MARWRLSFARPSRFFQLFNALVGARRRSQVHRLQKLKEETLPANGGIKSYFGARSFNHSLMILSDMPQTQKGSWFLHYKEKMDVELIDTIKATVFEIWRTKTRIRECKKKGNQSPNTCKAISVVSIRTSIK